MNFCGERALRIEMSKKVIDKYKNLPVQGRASFWFLICAFLQKGISFITTPIFTRLMSTTEYGQYSVFMSWEAILAVFITLNLSSGVYVQGLVKFEDDRNLFSSSLMGLTTFLVAVWAAIYTLFYKFFKNVVPLTPIQMVALFVIVWASAIFMFWSTDQRVDYKYRKLIFVTLIVSVVQPVVGVFLVLTAEDKVTARVLGMAAVELLAYIWFFFAKMFKGKRFFSSKYWKYSLQFNLPLLPHYLSSTIMSSADRIMIERMVGADAAGVYSLAYAVSMIMTILNSALLKTIEPWLYKKIKMNQTEDIPRLAYLVMLLVAVMNLLLIAFAPEVIAIFAPVEYYEAIWIIPPVAMSVYFMFAYTFFATFEFYYEKTKYIAIATVTGAALNIVLNYIFIGIFGYYAAGYTTLFCYTVFAVCHYLCMKKICREKMNDIKIYDEKILLTISIIFVAVGLAFLFLYKHIVVRYSVLLIAIVLLAVNYKKIAMLLKTILMVKKQ